ncbi:MAG: carboxymuconolactone decarboxylase family protein [Pseudomonadota bacterium]|nr:carboxymuconolactone decarboxylase family protein [Pseudomonadota bacterium]
MPRIPELSAEEMNPAQIQIYDDIMAGPRNSLRGPFHAWLHSPGLADPAQKLGAFCRFSSSLPKRLSELAIIVIARHWCAQFEWYAHAPMAMEAGITPDVVEAIRTKQTPTLSLKDEILIYEFVTELLEQRTVGQVTYDRAQEMLGHHGVVDLVGIVGYYCLVSATLNVFDMPLPDGEANPLSP